MWALIREPCDEPLIRSRPASGPCSKVQGRWILAATILASSMAFIDSTVVNVALAVLQTDMNATAIDVQWVIEGYALLLSAFLLIGGSLGDHHGRRRIFLLGIGIFAIASVACGFSATIRQLIVARAVQGFGAALLIPGSLAIISSSFAEKDRGRAIGTWSAFSAVTSGIGPALGGWLIEHFSWRAVFFINLPLAFVVWVISLRYVPEHSRQDRSGIDWLGASLAAVGLGLLIFGLLESSRLGFGHAAISLSLIGAVAVLGLFLIVEARHSHPMLPLKLFRSSSFTGANVLTFLVYGALGGTLFFLPLNLMQVQHYSPTASG
ncbi:MAG TPA: MFS transporter, partial [Chthoniobacterales bacterium]|nr:MFS transporter [Chthoniobacterales bacterium]